MRTPLRTNSIAIGLLVCLTAGTALLTGCGGDSEASYVYDNFADARAASDGKPILIDFYTDWCRFCKQMDTVTFKDSTVAAFLEDNILVAKVNAEVDSALAQSYNVTGYPTLVLVQPDGSEIDRFIGFYPPDQFLPTLSGYLQGEGTFGELKRTAALAADPITNIRLAEKYQQRQQVDKSLQLLDEALSIGTSDSLAADIMLRKANAYFMGQRYNDAAETFKSIGNEYPGSFGAEQAGYYLGMLYERLGDTTNAVDAYLKFVRDFPQSQAATRVKTHAESLKQAYSGS